MRRPEQLVSSSCRSWQVNFPQRELESAMQNFDWAKSFAATKNRFSTAIHETPDIPMHLKRHMKECLDRCDVIPIDDTELPADFVAHFVTPFRQCPTRGIVHGPVTWLHQDGRVILWMPIPVLRTEMRTVDEQRDILARIRADLKLPKGLLESFGTLEDHLSLAAAFRWSYDREINLHGMQARTDSVNEGGRRGHIGRNVMLNKPGARWMDDSATHTIVIPFGEIRFS